MSTTALLVMAVSALFAFGALTIALYGLRRPAQAGELWRIYVSTVIIAAVVLIPAIVHPHLFSIVVAAGAWRCASELASAYGRRTSPLGHLGFAVAAGAAVTWGAASTVATLPALFATSAALLALTVPLYIQACMRPPAPTRAWIVCATFPVLAAAHLSQLAHIANGWVWICLLYITIETHDSMASLFGRLLGRRRLLPELSPHKTVEGAVAGIGFGLAAGTLIGCLPLNLTWAGALALSAFVLISGICGDLFTSALKRAVHIKDFPPVHVLHGGVLDIYDSTLFAAICLSFGLWVAALAR